MACRSGFRWSPDPAWIAACWRLPATRRPCLDSRSDRRREAMEIRTATEADIPDIQSIYAHHVLTGTGTFEEEPPSVEEMTERIAHVVGHGWSWLVAADATGVLGYAYYTQFRDRSAYRYCVE